MHENGILRIGVILSHILVWESLKYLFSVEENSDTDME